MTLTDTSTEKLDMSRVFQLAIETGKRRFGRLAALWGLTIFALILLFGALALLAGGSFLAEIIAGKSPSFSTFQRILPIFGFGIFAAVVVSALIQAASFNTTLSDIAGRTTTLEEDLKVGLRKWIPLILVSILYTLAFGFGLVLFIVPGIMIALAFSQVMAVVIAEKGSFMDAFTRSRFLTRNNRWRLFGLWTVVWVAYMVLSGILTGLTGGFGPRAGEGAGGLASVGLSIFESLFASAAGYCLQAAIYAELRRIKDGVGAADLGAIFD